MRRLPFFHQQLSPSPGSFSGPRWISVGWEGSIRACRSQLLGQWFPNCVPEPEAMVSPARLVANAILKPTPDPLNQKLGMEQTIWAISSRKSNTHWDAKNGWLRSFSNTAPSCRLLPVGRLPISSTHLENLAKSQPATECLSLPSSAWSQCPGGRDNNKRLLFQQIKYAASTLSGEDYGQKARASIVLFIQIHCLVFWSSR